MIKKFGLFLFLLPFTLLLDFILFAFLKTCPACGNFWQFVAAEGALSFPLVVQFMESYNQLLSRLTREVGKR